MKKYLLFLIFSFLFCTQIAVAQNAISTEKLVILSADHKEHLFNVEIADTPQKAIRGLMYRNSMSKDHGMLFEFTGPPKMISFWMKNTFIPLDLIFIDSTGTIVSIRQGVPLSLSPLSSTAPASAVLEVNQGISAYYGIIPGDRVIHPFFSEK